jgi:hypothetical protein
MFQPGLLRWALPLIELCFVCRTGHWNINSSALEWCLIGLMFLAFECILSLSMG